MLGEYDFSDHEIPEGQAPGILGRVAVGPMGRVRDNLRKGVCLPWSSQNCLHLFSRFLEQTYRNFAVNVKPPTLVAPPFQKKIIDAFGCDVNIPGGPYGPGSFTTVVCHRVPLRHRAVVTHVGHSAESAAAFSDLAWRITIDGIPFDPWADVRIQLWEMAPPTKLCAGIRLREDNEICLEARSLSPADHTVCGRLCGWEFPVRSEDGDEIKSTFVN